MHSKNELSTPRPVSDKDPDDQTSLRDQLRSVHSLLSALLDGKGAADPLTGGAHSSGKYLTRKDLAAVLKVSLSTVDRLIGDGLPFTPVGGHRRFELAKVQAWLNRTEKRNGD